MLAQELKLDGTDVWSDLADLSGVNAYQKMTCFFKKKSTKGKWYGAKEPIEQKPLYNFCYKPCAMDKYPDWVYKSIAAVGYAQTEEQKFIMAVCLLPEIPKEKVSLEFR